MIVNEEIRDRAWRAMHKLDRWVQQRELIGYDPYDLKGMPFYLWLNAPSRRSSRLAKLTRGGLSVLEDVFPIGMRLLFGVRPSINAKALGLFAKAYLNLHTKKPCEGFFENSTACLRWLETNTSKNYREPCWGYPFDWQSTVFIPKDTPSSVVSWTVGDAFWDMYRASGDRRYLDICMGVCRFFVNNLNRDCPSEDQLIFSYTPVDRMHVLNATLFVGEFLIRIGNEIENAAYVREGRAAANYVIANQNEDGSWAYFGSDDNKPVTIDHYHTGFVLRMLRSISDATGDQNFEAALKKGFMFYWDEMFEPSGLPRYFVDMSYPVNIHSIAEALICLKLFDGRYRDTSVRLQWILEWALDNMQDEKGCFYFLNYKNRKVKIPFMRWGQAWMLLALSEVLT